MKVKLLNITNPDFVSGFLKVCRLPFPNAKETYALAKTLRQLQDESKTYDVARSHAAERYKVAHGQENFNDPDSVKSFADDMLAILNTDVEVFLDHKVEVVLQSDVTSSLSALEINALEDSGLVVFK